MFKRDLFEIAEEEPAEFVDPSHTARGRPIDRLATSSGGDLSGSASANSAPRRGSSDWRTTVALVLGAAGLLLSIAAIAGRPAEPERGSTAADPAPGRGQRQVERRARKSAVQSVTAGRKRRHPACAKVDRAGPPSAASTPPVALGQVPSEAAILPPQPAARVPVTPRRPLPRAGEFDLEVGYR